MTFNEVLDKSADKQRNIVTPLPPDDETGSDATSAHATTVTGARRFAFPAYIGTYSPYNGFSCDPNVQLLYYYRRFLSALPLDDTCLYPCLGLTIVDNIVHAGVVFVLPRDKGGTRFIARSRVKAYHLDYLSESCVHFEEIAAFFTAMRDLVFNLRAYYASFVPSSGGTFLRPPIPHSLTVSPSLRGKLHVNPQPRYYTKRLFSGEVKERFGTVPEGVKQVLVKYVEYYGHMAHQAAAGLGIAPTLYAVENVALNTQMVVMEVLVGFSPLCQIGDATVRKTAVRAVLEGARALHRAGFVHGDLHAANVLVKNGSGGAEIRLVDFDWSGRCDVDKYPATPNPTLAWHKGVARGKPLSAAHDEYACAALARYAKDPEAEKEKQTVTPPEVESSPANICAGELEPQKAAAGAGGATATTTAPEKTSKPPSTTHKREFPPFVIGVRVPV